MKTPIRSRYALWIALFALLIAVIALYQAQAAKELALSDLTVEENNSLITPLYDQEKNSWSYLAIYEITVANLCGPSLQWLDLHRLEEGSGFLVGFKNGQLTSSPLSYQAFICEPTCAQIQANPKLIRELVKSEFLQSLSLNYTLAPGESKSVRLGVLVQTYDLQQQPLADMVLLSIGFKLDHNRHYTFRRGFPVQPVKTE